MRIVILTLPLGGGHAAAAHAVADSLKAQSVGVEVVVADLSRVIAPNLRIDRLLKKIYALSVDLFDGAIHRWIYRYSERHPELVSNLVDRVFGRRAKRWLVSQAPDLVISTFSVAGYVAKRQLRTHGVPVVTVVTDAGSVNRIWFSGDIDCFFLSDPASIDVGTVCGVSSERMLVSGPPISRKYSNLPSKRDARIALGLKDTFTVLITGGGLGLGQNSLKVARQIVARDLPVQLILAPGANSRLMNRFKSISRQCDLVMDGFTSDFPAILAASDLVVGKAGWLTLNEAAAANTPTLIVDVLPGQEEENVAFATKAGFARVMQANNVVDMIEKSLSGTSVQQSGLDLEVKDSKLKISATNTIAIEICRILHRNGSIHG